MASFNVSTAAKHSRSGNDFGSRANSASASLRGISSIRPLLGPTLVIQLWSHWQCSSQGGGFEGYSSQDRFNARTVEKGVVTVKLATQKAPVAFPTSSYSGRASEECDEKLRHGCSTGLRSRWPGVED